MKRAALALIVALAFLPAVPGSEWTFAPAAAHGQTPKERLTIYFTGNAQSRQFFHDFETDAAFRAQIKARFDCFRLDVTCRGLVCVTRPPAPYFRAGNLPTLTGYRGKADFLRRLRIDPVVAQPQPAQPAGSPYYDPTEAAPAGAPPTQTPSQHNRPEQAAPAGSAPTEHLPPLQLPPERREKLQAPAPATNLPTTQPPEPVGGNTHTHDKPPAPPSADEPTADRSGWLMKWIGRAAFAFNLTHPAGQAATLLTLASGALSWIVARRRGRKASPVCKRCSSLEARLGTARTDCDEQTAALRSQIEQLEAECDQLRNQTTKTETHYVEVPADDAVGEAYKEACRRIVQTTPTSAGIVRQIEATATQIIHGRGVVRRESSGRQATTANPGIFWRD